MVYRGTARGKMIELDEQLAYEEGTPLYVTVRRRKRPRKGSPEALLQLAGTLTHEEAELIRQAGSEMRHIPEIPEGAPPKGSLKAALRLAGSMTHEEAELMRQLVSEVRKIDESLWK